MLNTEYLGLKLKSPVIVSSGPLTQNAVSLKKCEEAGAGAVVPGGHRGLQPDGVCRHVAGCGAAVAVLFLCH